MTRTPLYGNSPVELVTDSINPRKIEYPLHIELSPRQGKLHIKAETYDKKDNKVEICNELIDGLPHTLPFEGSFVQLKYKHAI